MESGYDLEFLSIEKSLDYLTVVVIGKYMRDIFGIRFSYPKTVG